MSTSHITFIVWKWFSQGYTSNEINYYEIPVRINETNYVPHRLQQLYRMITMQWLFFFFTEFTLKFDPIKYHILHRIEQNLICTARVDLALRIEYALQSYNYKHIDIVSYVYTVVTTLVNVHFVTIYSLYAHVYMYRYINIIFHKSHAQNAHALRIIYV